jgi:hypothetical protein
MPKDRPALHEVVTALGRVGPEVWDAVLPDARPEEAPSRVTPASTGPATSTVGVTAGGSTETGAETVGGGTEVGADPTSAAADVALPRRLIVGDGPPLEVQQPVFVPKHTRRWVKRTLVIAASLFVGLAIGIVVLLLV